MFSAADLVAALRERRTPRSIRPDVPGTLPPGWQAWLETMRVRPGRVAGAPPGSFVDAFIARPLRSPPPAGMPLDRWRAFATLWRQQWQPPAHDERGLRIVGMVSSGTVHVLLAALLVWLMDARFMRLPPMADDESSRLVEVQFIGRGSREQAGGASAGGQAPARSEAATAVPTPPAPSSVQAPPPAPDAEAPLQAVVRPARAPGVDVARPRIDAPSLVVPERPVPMPRVPASQPLAVIETPAPDSDFQLPARVERVDADPPAPATTTVVIEVPRMPVREVPEPVAPVEARTTEPVVALEAPTIPVIIPTTPTRPVEAPEPRVRPDFAQARRPRQDVAAPTLETQAPTPRRRPVPEPVASAPAEPAEPAPATEAVAVETPAPAPAAASPAPAPATAPAETPTAQATAPAPAASAPATGPGAGRVQASAPTGSGREPVATPGAWPTPTASDDWGDALRDRPGAAAGQAPGLFDGDGRPRLPGDDGPARRAQPPGMVEERIADLDRAGEWMQRPAFPYEPTRFDRFWIPGGTLLEEWVRRGVRELAVPIPGTSKRLQCVVSVLQLGGGCWVSDPNLNDQPSSGRPAPEVPFRPELFEDQDALEPPPGD